jgi:hypothetical protein
MRLFRTVGLLSVGAFAGFWGAAQLAKRALPSRGEPDSDEVALTAIFDGVKLNSHATAFRGGSAVAWFGGVDLDLREAQLAPDARLSTSAIFGGVRVRVPLDWRIESSLRARGGGVDVSGHDPDDPDAPVLVVDGIVAFGGVAVDRAGAAKAEDAAAPTPA